MKNEPPESIPEKYREHVASDLANVAQHCLDDQKNVYNLYEVAVIATTHSQWEKRILTGPEGLAHDIYEVFVGSIQ
ncbi:MAG TPA: hypothetical protein VLE93_00890 [Candidatus Saccharimonadales bacterium]|nr:hypothetical protein [Candidatus Saccharimonadales bacterium]